VSEFDELRALVREVIRDVLPHGLPVNGLPVNGLPVTETVDLSTDADLAAFVARLLDLDPGEREDLQSGRKRFRLAGALDGTTPGRVPAAPRAPLIPSALSVTRAPLVPSALPVTLAPAATPGSVATPASAPSGAPVRRVESGAVTEALVKQAAQAGERLVLGRGAVLTPLARDRARASGVEIVKER